MSASIQWHCGTLRLDEHDGTYAWACLVLADPQDPETAVLIGAMTAPQAQHLRAIGAVLKSAGFARVTWQRRHKGRPRWVAFALSDFAL